MEITKQQALDLVKVLSHYETLTNTNDGRREIVPTCNVDVLALLRFLEVSLTDVVDDEDSRHWDNELPPGWKDSEDSEEKDLECDDEVSVWTLHSLSSCRATAYSTATAVPGTSVTLEFKESDDGFVSLLVNGDDELKEVVGPISYVRRGRSMLEVAEEDSGAINWHSFDVSKFPKQWTSKLPVNQLLLVLKGE